MIILGVVLAAATGYGISVSGDEPAPTNVAGSQAAGADQLILNKAAELAAERQNLLNQATKGIGPAAAPSNAGALELADQLTRSAVSKIGTDAWDSYLNPSGVQGAGETPTFDRQTGPR